MANLRACGALALLACVLLATGVQGRELKQIRVTTPTPFRPLTGPTTTTVRATPFVPGGPQVTQQSTQLTPFNPFVGPVTTTGTIGPWGTGSISVPTWGRKLLQFAIRTPTLNPLTGPRTTVVRPTPFRPGGPQVTSSVTRATPFNPFMGPLTTTSTVGPWGTGSITLPTWGRKLKQITFTTPTPFQPFTGPTTTTVRPTPFVPGGPQVTQQSTQLTPFIPFVGPVTTTSTNGPWGSGSVVSIGRK
ncbi:hypothetical protein Rsub_11655 [Raphidocelis subcapitata]|uniref:Uncharacterized protein n=1 Tax=Raphidocelis subcapitata TaxID=307507 RepID=A0A2V0PFR2_9CHLO|nr:hypothetical protein Rsub_11655 [Raphidocelis subcapitata]|eukprot:GBF98661.1 hypothetical protein Rsub_11655 [Raphidocelis subcapitata]